MGKKIISVNTGSSSLKLTVADQETLETVFRAEKKNVVDFTAATNELVDTMKQEFNLEDIVAIGHRIVHGGSQAHTARLIDDEVLAEIHQFAEFDPMHSEPALVLITQMQHLFPQLPHIACFDTAFFHDIPRVAQLIALPHEYQHGEIRRYGFHGLSYIYVLEALRHNGVAVDNEKIVVAHLGSGASLAAIQNGHAVDMTMGFTPTSGIVMSSRLGDTDPGLVGYLHKKFGMTIEDWTTMTNKASGLLGVSGLSADMYTVLQAEHDNPDARDAVDLFVYRVRQAISSLAASMNGIDRLVFTGGIGEASEPLRSRILEGLTFLNIAHTEVVNTDESVVILRKVKELLTQ